MNDFAAIATQYARDVAELRLPACRWVRLAAARHLRDLERAAAGGWRYAWNPELQDAKGKSYRPADRVCGFALLMPHVKGDWAARGELIVLEPWQVFILASIFGWIDAASGKRRFRVADLFVPRKNAKSTIAAVVGNYMLAFDDEFGAEVYSGATSLKQALEVFKPARDMAKASEEFRASFGVEVNVSNLSVPETNSKFEPVIGRPGDGASPSCGIVDEYHEHKTAELYETLKTGMLARSQALLLVITTAGWSVGGPCHEHQQQLEKILQGIVEDDRRFGVIYGIDADDDWTQPEALLKANPNLGISVDEETLLADQQEALRDPRKQAVFKTKHLNVWVNSASPWLNLESLQRAADPSLRIEQFDGERCWKGLDLASKNDIATKASLFRREVEGEDHFYLFTRNYLPKAAIDRPENAHYRGWVVQGFIVATPGNMINLKQIQEDVEADSDLHEVASIALDAWGSREIAPSLQDGGFSVIDVPMTTRHLSEPMKQIAALVDAGRFHFDGNSATLWMFSNVEVAEDRNENIFPRKGATEKKIDAAVATILAMGRAMLDDDGGPQGFVDLNSSVQAPAQNGVTA